MVFPYRDGAPRIDPSAYVAPGAVVAGDVTLGPEASVWFNSVVRGDSDRVEIGARTNVQDLSVVHVDAGKPCVIGEDCVIGHGAIVHGCTIGRGSLIGMGAIVLSGAVVGEECVVAAGALVPEGRSIPARSMVVGAPARLLRSLSDEDLARLVRPGVAHYLEHARAYREAAPGP